MRDLRLRCILIVFAATVLFAVPAFAQEEGAQDDVRQADLDSLKAKLYFVGKLSTKYPDSGFGQTWSHLETDVRDALGRHAEAEEFHAVRRQVLLSWGSYHRDAGHTDLALEPLAALVRDYDSGADGYREAAKTVADIHLARAETAGTDSEKLDAYRLAHGYYEKIGDTRATTGIRSKVIDLQAREGIRLTEEKKYGEAYDLLTELEAREGSLGEGRAAEALEMLREKTGILTVRLKDVNARGREVNADFVLVLTAKSGGESTETAFAPSLRWLAGEYEVGLRLPGKDTLSVRENTAIGAAGGEVTFPRVFPDGMVYVSAGGDVARPFFIDETEVTEAAYKAFDPGYRRPTAATGGNLPAHGISFEKAKAYAASVGKKLPTEAQWLHAAFKGRDMRYPWGPKPATGDAPKKFCHIGDTGGPGPVDAHSKWPSPCGALNMAGNVWEWLRDEYAIGGGFRHEFLEYDVGWKADFLRDKKPSERLYRTPGYPHGRKYKLYQLKNRNLQEVGIRCVIEL